MGFPTAATPAKYHEDEEIDHDAQPFVIVSHCHALHLFSLKANAVMSVYGHDNVGFQNEEVMHKAALLLRITHVVCRVKHCSMRGCCRR